MGIESPIHLLFIGIVALLVLGPKRLPEMAKRLGDGVREFRQAIDAGTRQHENPPVQHEPPPAPPADPVAAPPPQPPDVEGTPPHA
ncbi:MAG TPA: twin-arginine translocase TatA/TatE family subunit [Solirubrobacteraceae bacterium]|nr:twin-arginine translocase TatA/TatE family subunit [Solirubrobacteraceae bacterium]